MIMYMRIPPETCYVHHQLSLRMRKLTILVSDQVRHKPVYTVTEESFGVTKKRGGTISGAKNKDADQM